MHHAYPINAIPTRYAHTHSPTATRPSSMHAPSSTHPPSSQQAPKIRHVGGVGVVLVVLAIGLVLHLRRILLGLVLRLLAVQEVEPLCLEQLVGLCAREAC